jgi:hypothetical protein
MRYFDRFLCMLSLVDFRNEGSCPFLCGLLKPKRSVLIELKARERLQLPLLRLETRKLKRKRRAFSN